MAAAGSTLIRELQVLLDELKSTATVAIYSEKLLEKHIQRHALHTASGDLGHQHALVTLYKRAILSLAELLRAAKNDEVASGALEDASLLAQNIRRHIEEIGSASTCPPATELARAEALVTELHDLETRVTAALSNVDR